VKKQGVQVEERKLKKISEYMNIAQDFVDDELVHSPEDAVLLASALMAITRNLYVQTLGVEHTAKMFEVMADSFLITETMIEQYKQPTIH
jgi:hypothetical protein